MTPPVWKKRSPGNQVAPSFNCPPKTKYFLLKICIRLRSIFLRQLSRLCYFVWVELGTLVTFSKDDLNERYNICNFSSVGFLVIPKFVTNFLSKNLYHYKHTLKEATFAVLRSFDLFANVYSAKSLKSFCFWGQFISFEQWKHHSFSIHLQKFNSAKRKNYAVSLNRKFFFPQNFSPLTTNNVHQK